MDIVIGPILQRAGGYAFDLWTAGAGIDCGFPYRRIDDADYARKAAIREARRNPATPPVVCQTIDEFVARRSSGPGGLREAA